MKEASLWFDSCKRPPPVSDHTIFTFWVVAYGRFECIMNFVFATLLMDRRQASYPTEGLINLIGNTGARDHRTASKKRSDEGGDGLNGTS